MFKIDHVVVWTSDRDAALSALSAATGLPILEGYAPEGRLQARGVRFANGPFLDVHEAPGHGPVFMGLGGRLADAEALAERQGWRVKVGAGPDEPWDMLSFRKDQGLITQLFVIDYRLEQVTALPAFNRGLYHLPPTGGPPLARVWIAAADVARAGADLAALGFEDGGEVRSIATPFAGRLYRGSRGDVVVCAGEDAVVRIDVPTEGELVEVALGPKARAVVGREVAIHRG
jgi:hypothetical protein